MISKDILHQSEETHNLIVCLLETCHTSTGKVLLAGTEGRLIDIDNCQVIVDFGLFELNSLPAESQHLFKIEQGVTQ